MTLYTPEISNDDIIKDKKQKWRTFCLDQNLWEIDPKIVTSLKLDWQEVKFEEVNKNKIPNSQGIYIFMVKSNLKTSSNFENNYILYVGQTINLYDRFKSYFKYKTSSEPSDQLKRVMVLLWENYLYFNYVETTLTPENLTDLEFDLIDSVVPPMNLRFRATAIKSYVKMYSPR